MTPPVEAVGTETGSQSAYVADDGDFISIGNARIEAVFSKSRFFAVQSIKDKVHGTDLVGDAGGVFALWWLQVINGSDYQDLLSLSSDPSHTSFKTEQSAGEAKVTFSWDGVFDGTRWMELDVTAEVSVSDSEDFLDFRIDIENGEEVAIIKVYFPLITGITVLGSNGEDDRLAFPSSSGYLIENPLESLAPGVGWQGFADYGAGDWRQSSDYPGSLPLQLLSFYEEAKGGFYLTTLDPEGNAKGYVFDYADGELVMSVLMYPDRFAGGNDLSQLYPLHIGVFDGGWQDAALVYRQWAEQQWWTEKGTLAERSDVPEWWVRSGLTLHLETYDDYGDQIISLEDGKHAIDFLDRHLDSHLSVRWRGGFQVVRPDEIEEMSTFARDHNASIIYHTNGRLVMGDDPQSFIGSGATDWWGHPYTEDNPYWSGYIMCPDTNLWRDHLADQWQAVVDHGSVGIYVDQIAATPWVPCFNADHGHEPGQTGPWWVEAERRLHQEAAAEIEQTHPDVQWSSEMQSEVYLPLFQSALAWQVGAETLFGMRCAQGARFIPLFEFVYHEYTSSFGADSPLNDWTVHSEVIDYNIAYDFVSGKCPGVFINPLGNFDVDNLYQPTFGYLVSLADLRAGELNPFLLFGEMLKDPRISVDRISVPFSNLVGQVSLITNTSKILYSTWKAPDGRSAIVLTNWREAANQLEITVAPQDLEVLDGASLLLFKDEDGSYSVLERAWNRQTTISLELAGHSTQAIVADPSGAVPPPPPRRARGRAGGG